MKRSVFHGVVYFGLFLGFGCGGGVAQSETPAALVEAKATTRRAPSLKQRCDSISEQIACPTGRKRKQFSETNAGATCSAECLPNGARVSLDFNTGLQERGQYIDGEAAGTWRTYGEDHNLERRLLSERTFAGGKQHGPARAWDPDGQLRSEDGYFEGQQHGVSRRFGPNGQKLSEGAYEHGAQVGAHTTWFLNRRRRSVRNYDPEGKPDGQWCSWRSDGSEVNCFEMVHGSGTMKEYGPGGDLTLEYELRDGENHGRWASYRNNVLEHEARYEDDVLHGQTLEYREGCLEKLTTWSRGAKQGPYFEQTCPGPPQVKTREGAYCQDKMCGRWVERGPDGRLEVEYQFNDKGDLINFVAYDANGDPVERETAP